MNFTRLLSCFAVAVSASFLASCGNLVGLGHTGTGDYAATRINSQDTALIHATAVDVFTAAGFTPARQRDKTISFYKQGSAGAQLLWGSSVSENPVWIRPDLTVRHLPVGSRLSCLVSITQSHTPYGDNVRHPDVMGRTGYRKLLEEIRDRVEAYEGQMIYQQPQIQTSGAKEAN